MDTATNVKVKQIKNWSRTLLPFPRMTEGMTEDSTKIQAKAWMKTIISIRESSIPPAAGKRIFRKLRAEYTAVCVNS
jgi:hypothetical protein